MKVSSGILVLIIVVGLSGIGFKTAGQENAAIKKATMQDQNKETIRKLYEECLNKRNYQLINQFFSENYAGIRGDHGPEGFTEALKSIIQAFPDIKWKIEDLMADGNKVIIRWTWKGTHTGTFRDFLPASHNQVEDHAIVIYEFRDGKIVSSWIESDRLGFLQQVGVVPQDLRKLVISNE